MPRQPRRISSSGVYHVIIRGINMQRIFEDDEDCTTFLDFLCQVKDASNTAVLAYCLMGNHAHLVVGQGDEPLGDTMRRLAVRYAAWFNLKYGRLGHLFQDRFKSEAVESDSYLVTVLRYVYNNPVKAGLCDFAGDYAWSSHCMLGKASRLIDVERLKALCDIEDLLFLVEESGEKDTNDIKGLPLDADDLPRKRKTDALMSQVMSRSSGAATTSAFQSLDKDSQKLTILTMLKEGASIRQAARITGLSKGLVESWARISRRETTSNEGDGL